MLIVLALLAPLLNTAKTILGIGGLILVHELGHFLVGRWCGVRAEVFSIGFGPAIAKWKPGTTEYRLSWIPLGGYVKFADEYSSPPGEVEPDSFPAATYPRKVAIMLAGVTMNVIAALFLFVATFAIGIDMPAPIVGSVPAGRPAWAAGLQVGDEFVTIDGKRVISFLDVTQDVMLKEQVEVVMRRDGELMPALTLRPEPDAGGLRRIGVGPAVIDVAAISIAPGGVAETAGFEEGDRTISVDGTATPTLLAALEAAEAAQADSVWTVERGGEQIDITLPWTPASTWRIGIARDSETIDVVRAGGAADRAGIAAGMRPVSVGGIATLTLQSFQAALRDRDVTGPIEVSGTTGAAKTLDVAPEDHAAVADSIAVALTGFLVSPQLAKDAPTAARDAGMVPGCVLEQLDGSPLTDWMEMVNAVSQAGPAGKGIELTWRTPAGDTQTATITPEEHAGLGDVGIGSRPLFRNVQETDVVAAMSLGVDRTDRWVRRILNTLGSLVTGEVSATNLSGPVAIARLTYRTAETGWGDFFLFLGMISMNLAVLNLLPIPMLDGGQLVVITLVKVRGRPLPDRVLEGIQWAGLILLLGLMVFVIANDIRQL